MKKKIIFASLLLCSTLLVGGLTAVGTNNFKEANAAPGDLVSTITIADYAAAQDPAWQNEEKHLTISDSVVTYTDSNAYGGNSGKYYTSDKTWRLSASATNEAKRDTLTVSVSNQYELVSCKFDYSYSKAKLLYGTTEVKKNTAFTVSGQSAVFSISPTGTSGSGQIKFKSLETTYRVASDATKVQEVLIDAIDENLLYVGEEITLTGSALPNEASQDLTWSVNKQPSELGEAILTDNKLVLTHEGDLTIRATALTDSTVYKDKKITIKSAPWTDLSYTGELAPQKIGNPFDPTGLKFVGTRSSVDGYSRVYDLTLADLVIPTAPLTGQGGVSQVVEIKIKDTEVSTTITFTPTLLKVNTYTPINSINDLNTGDIVVIASTVNGVTKVACNSSINKYSQLDAGDALLENTNLVLDDLTTSVAHYRVNKDAAGLFSLLDIVLNTYLDVENTGVDIIYSKTEVKFKLLDGVRVNNTTPILTKDLGQADTDRSILFSDAGYFKNYKNNNSSNTKPSSYNEVKLYKLTSENLAVTLQDTLTAWSNYHLKMQNSAFNGDGTGECLNLYGPAKNALNALNKNYPGAISELQSNANLAEAKLRYETWAKFNNDATPYDGLEFVQAAHVTNLIDDNSTLIAIIVVVSLLSVSAIVMFAVIKRKKLVK